MIEKKTPEKKEVVLFSVLEEVMAFTAAVLFLIGLKRCLLLLFPAQKFPVHFVVYAIYNMLPLFIFRGLGRGIFQDAKKFLNALAVMVYAAALCGCIWNRHESLLKNSRNLLESYLAQVNVYYDLHLTAGGNLHALDNRLELLFFGIGIFLFFLILGEIGSKRYLFSMPLLYGIIFLMAVGKTPDYRTFACGFSGMVLVSFANMLSLDGARGELLEKGRWKHPFYSGGVIAALCVFLAAVIPICSYKIFKSPVKKIMNYVPVVKEFQQELESTVEAVVISRLKKGEEVVDNESPSYTGAEVMEISIQGKAPKENQYFRGFYGTDYVNGNWVNDDGSFEKACKEQGYSPEKLSEFLAFPAHSYFQRRKSGIETFPDSKIEQREMILSYKGFGKGHVYLPYMLGEVSGSKTLTFTQDAYMEKDAFQRKFKFSTWDPAYFEETTLSASRHFSEIEALYSDEDETEKEWKTWYDQYVKEHYLNASPLDVLDVWKVILEEGSSGKGKHEKEGIYKTKEESERIGIWNITNKIQEIFKNFTYSLELEKISSDIDSVEYFLNTSHTGYCVHFASAGVLLLRKFGIPARYATGYVVHPGNWKKNQNGGYTAKVLDRNAHAWAEVYFEGLGWLPIEMTPGDGQSVQVAEKEKPQKEEKETGEEDQEKEEEAVSEEIDTPKESDSPVPTLSAAEPVENIKKGNSVKKTSSTGTYRLLFVLFLFLSPILYVFVRYLRRHFFSKKKRKRWRIFNGIPKGKNRTIVCKLNRRLYKRLCKKRHLFKRRMTDAEYERLLQKTYPEKDWSEFMRIVKKASFSEHEITEEEVLFCASLLE